MFFGNYSIQKCYFKTILYDYYKQTITLFCIYKIILLENVLSETAAGM